MENIFLSLSISQKSWNPGYEFQLWEMSPSNLDPIKGMILLITMRPVTGLVFCSR